MTPDWIEGDIGVRTDVSSLLGRYEYSWTHCDLKSFIGGHVCSGVKSRLNSNARLPRNGPGQCLHLSIMRNNL